MTVVCCDTDAVRSRILRMLIVKDTRGALQCGRDFEYSGQVEGTLHLIGKLSQESWYIALDTAGALFKFGVIPVRAPVAFHKRLRRNESRSVICTSTCLVHQYDIQELIWGQCQVILQHCCRIVIEKQNGVGVPAGCTRA